MRFIFASFRDHLTILAGKNCIFLNLVQEWLHLIFFLCLHKQLSFIHSIMMFSEYGLKNVIHHIVKMNGSSIQQVLRQNWCESIKIENASFPYKTAIWEVNFKTNRMVCTKWTYHKEWSFASNYFIFLKVLIQCKSLL